MAGETDVDGALARLAAASPAGEDRPGQGEMARAVAAAVETGRPLIVQAGTGTGKTWAYLVPLILAGKRAVVATATKALQDQLAGKDLPFLREHLGRRFSYALLKGRANYVCRQRLAEIAGPAEGQLALDGLAERAPVEELRRIQAWSATTESGDRAELEFEPMASTWAAVSVSSKECPGASRCPQGETCFTEQARRAAAAADVVVVNTHLYGLHLESGGVILPEHDVLVVDEAHQLEDTISATFGIEMSGGRFHNLARVVGAVLDDDDLLASVARAGDTLTEALTEHHGRRLRGALETDIADALATATDRLERVRGALGRIDGKALSGEVSARLERARKLTGSLTDEVAAVLDRRVTDVAWVEGREDAPVMRVAPVDVAQPLRDTLWGKTTAVLTSATIPPTMAVRLGLDETPHDELDVGSPFDHEGNALLYCARHLPDPRNAAFEPAMHLELEALIGAAGGRTLALFTSYRAMDAAVEALRDAVDFPILSQRDLPKPALVARFAAEPETCLFATMGFWQGIDVPGPALTLVTLDRIPFPRPDEPLLQARRERARADAFRLIDLPRAVTLLAQGAGRLIRTSTDRGVVAVLDPRLSKATYAHDMVAALPPMRRTRDRAVAEAFLRSLRD